MTLSEELEDPALRRVIISNEASERSGGSFARSKTEQENKQATIAGVWDILDKITADLEKKNARIDELSAQIEAQEKELQFQKSQAAAKNARALEQIRDLNVIVAQVKNQSLSGEGAIESVMDQLHGRITMIESGMSKLEIKNERAVDELGTLKGKVARTQAKASMEADVIGMSVSKLHGNISDLQKHVERLEGMNGDPEHSHYQTGVVDWRNELGAKEFRCAVRFDFPFKRNPKVFVAFSQMDTSKAANLRLETWPLKVEKDKFIVAAKTWSDTHVFKAKVAWVACDL